MDTTSLYSQFRKCLICLSFLLVCRLAGDQRARRDVRNDSDAEDDDDVKKVCLKDSLDFIIRNI